MTKLTAVSPGGDCPEWKKFLERVTKGDTELQSYLQRVCGYLLTGVTTEQALFFLYGLGGNGKSVLINTISGILGDYAKVAAMETFTASTTDRHPTEIADLKGARLVTANETEEGRTWAESKIKALTGEGAGGGKIKARFMRQDPFEFVPQFKLMFAGNHRPRLRSVDHAIRRRMNLVPFNVTISEEERDRKLAEKLKREWPGILGWAIEGCIEWQRIGLKPPPIVTEATEAYLDDEDTFKTWFEDCCTRSKDAFTPISHLYYSWQTWAQSAGEYVMPERRLRQRLASEGFPQGRRRIAGRNLRGFVGLALNGQPNPAPPQDNAIF
jgi:putative DNA primase/helicase